MTSRPIVLIGLPGVGKSSVGPLVAARLGRRFVDLDQVIEAAAGLTIPELFERHGEDEFRRRESAALIQAMVTEDRAVIAGGGGVVLDEANRRALDEQAIVVWLDVAVAALVARLGDDGGRPLLDGGVEHQLRRLHRERLPFYTTSADQVVADSGATGPEELADTIVAAVTDDRDGIRTELVAFGDGRSYPVLIGRGAKDLLADVVADVLPPGLRRVAIITQDGIGIDADPGVEHRVFTVEDGEVAKRLDVVGRLASELARWGLTRNDAVVSIGGGVVSDLAGYLAASYHRGIEVVHVSTTLLGQIDAAIGGKCGVNLPEGKNLLGAFKQPAAVICDTRTLSSLPPAEFISGMGELAKYHFLGGGRLDRLAMTPRVAACVRIKADVVVGDEREGGRRAVLNYGHTLAHALESAAHYGIRHGEAVAVGLVYAAELARSLGRIDDQRVAEHRRVVEAYGLSAAVPPGLEPDELIDAFSRDKKAVDGITFVLDGPDGIEPVLVEDRALLRSTLERVV